MPLVTLSLLWVLAPGDTTRAPGTKPPAVVRFTGDVGFVSTSGNSSAQTLNLGNKISAKLQEFTLSQQFAVIHGRSKGETITSQWRGSVRGDYAFEPTFSVYTAVNYERNTFAGLALRVGTVTGLSAQLFKTERDRLVLEGGLSLTAQRGTGTGKDLDFLGGRAATAFVHQIGPRASLTQSIELLPNFRQDEDLRVNSESALLAPLTRQVGLKLSYIIRYDGLPEVGYQRTDRLFTSGIQINL